MNRFDLDTKFASNFAVTYLPHSSTSNSGDKLNRYNVHLPNQTKQFPEDSNGQNENPDRRR
jgi:hypothetical protein